MNNLKIGSRLGLAFGSMVLLITVVAVVAFLKTNNINEQVKQLTDSNSPKMIATYEVQRSVLNILRSVALIAGIEDEALRAKEQSYIEAQRREYKESIAVLRCRWQRPLDFKIDFRSALRLRSSHWKHNHRWWVARSSKPVRGVRNFPGGFDSHVFPP